jgi:hypothetical protein
MMERIGSTPKAWPPAGTLDTAASDFRFGGASEDA